MERTRIKKSRSGALFRQMKREIYLRKVNQCGGGESRTPVQGRDTSHFYMFSLTFVSHSGAGGKLPLSEASPKVLISAVRTLTKTSPSDWRSILTRQANIRRNGLHDIKRKLRCRSWHLCYVREDSAGDPGPAHATRRFSCSVEANRPHCQWT